MMGRHYLHVIHKKVLILKLWNSNLIRFLLIWNSVKNYEPIEKDKLKKKYCKSKKNREFLEIKLIPRRLRDERERKKKSYYYDYLLDLWTQL